MNRKLPEDRSRHPYIVLARISAENSSRGFEPFAGIARDHYLHMDEMKLRRACFVSIKSGNGELRGCIGTVEPAFPNLFEEIVANAHSAACRDPRFLPLAPDEFFDCRISVDVLEKPESITDISLLDPAIFGVIVEKDFKKGVLLPDLEGISNPLEQVSIAMRKAGISSWKGILLKRFKVLRFSEKQRGGV
jgi:AmmeMemoRadiSam system protein A